MVKKRYHDTIKLIIPVSQQADIECFYWLSQGPLTLCWQNVLFYSIFGFWWDSCSLAHDLLRDVTVTFHISTEASLWSFSVPFYCNNFSNYCLQGFPGFVHYFGIAGLLRGPEQTPVQTHFSHLTQVWTVHQWRPGQTLVQICTYTCTDTSAPVLSSAQTPSQTPARTPAQTGVYKGVQQLACIFLARTQVQHWCLSIVPSSRPLDSWFVQGELVQALPLLLVIQHFLLLK